MSSDWLTDCSGFEWDTYNADKIWNKHHISISECEQIFFNIPFIIADDVEHSQYEKRYYTLGRTDEKKLLFVVFTIRQDKIRIISAREMSRKERRLYQSHEKENPTI